MIDLEQIESMLKATLGTQVRLVDYRIANHQQDYRVILARLYHPDLEIVIKLAGPRAQMACQFDRTAAIYRLVSQSTLIPMPDVRSCNIVPVKSCNIVP